MKKKGVNDQFLSSMILNCASYDDYLQRLIELSISSFEWTNLPLSVDSRYIEMTLLQSGQAVYFRDEVLGDLCLDCLANGNFDVYGNPVKRRGYSRYNNYSINLDETNSVIIWNNMLRKSSYNQLKLFALRLYNLDRIIDVNCNAQKTPVLVQGNDKQRLTLLNLYKEYEGNAPFIFGDKNLDLNSLKVLQTGAPYVSDKIYEMKVNVWNEALTYLGISNLSVNKKERLITDEVQRNQGGTIASRYSRLQSRKDAVAKINNMFSTDIDVNFRDDYNNGGDFFE